MKKTTILVLGSILMLSPTFSTEERDANLPAEHAPLHKNDGGEYTEKLLTSVTSPATSTARLRTGGMGAWGCHYWERDFSYSTPSEANSRESSS